MLCSRCYGSGEIMGQGMMFQDCSCLYAEEVQNDLPKNQCQPKSIQIDKRSKEYREALAKLMQENKMNREDAAALFEEEFNKIA